MTTPTDAFTIAQRRAAVAELLRDNMSQRKIAERLGVTKDVVYRDIQALSRVTATPPNQDRRAPVAPDILTVALPAAASSPDPTTPSRDTATPAALHLAVPLDAALVADLATLTRNGTAPEDAIRRAVAQAAKGYRLAWGIGLYPRTTDPVVSRHQFVPYQPTEHETASPPDPPTR
ncbi:MULTISPECIES: HTH domain-containing protein [Streptomyces]|uniref:Helix-turn-helix type 11 domain-containing protein n=2 Tax=root TaxID=1 RepID=F2R689_STRVP|nr:HTH domain-containing protein [Streptomyces venezuelae]YP_010754263.1 DNA-binding protein [Streptomyces phage Chymera]AMS01610.1 DNA-binding protein [Streptomyces phage Chymera]APE22028.1 hypothetical protein vnz_14035 [Streptomyces venezuelae]QER99417.1 HTH domain-containing protein [Streptomyces venezuelae ATCC 10712]CCA56140.1 hypothetical protein SVEN_2854 [Streptomyces venezuelae ATCC 10712]